jgi:hypothetical protein
VFAQNLASVLASTLLNANTKTFSARQADRAEHLCEYLLGGGTLEFVVLQTGCEELWRDELTNCASYLIRGGPHLMAQPDSTSSSDQLTSRLGPGDLISAGA